MSSAQKSLVAIAQGAGLALLVSCTGLMVCLRSKSVPSVGADASADVVAPGVASSTVVAAPAPPAPPDYHEVASTGIEVVNAAIGRWETKDGTLAVMVDPPKPAGSKRPRYHLIVERSDMSGYGCDFAEMPTVDGGSSQIVSYDMTFRAWCGGEAHAKAKHPSLVAITVVGKTMKILLRVDESAKLDRTLVQTFRK